jgi:hypothetical protein
MIAKVRLIAALLDKNGKRIDVVRMECTPMHIANLLERFSSWVLRRVLEIDFGATAIDEQPKGDTGNG